MAWYYDWFPTAKSYLQHGTLLTGEASPGYLPYPKAVHAVQKRLPGGAKILAVGRDPLQRMYSSYKYNYRAPTLEFYQKHGKSHHGIRAHQNESYYEPYLFSFEDFVRTELGVLQDCLHEFGPQATTAKWSKLPWAQKILKDREYEGLPPMIDLDAVCYTSTVLPKSKPQWKELFQEHPENYISQKHAFLIQAFIGRSLYVFPLEWWYAALPQEDLLFVCTEELSDPEVLRQLALDMGLPSHNFSTVVAEGVFNAGGHKGYDEATPWDQLSQEDSSRASKKTIPLSPELRRQVLDFVRPFNERLFQLVGKRCDWTDQ